MDQPRSSQGLLAVYDTLPDLLKMAWEQKQVPGDNVYGIQDALREEHREKAIPFRWSMPYRCLYHCEKCGHADTAIDHELENPKVKDEASPLHRVELSELEVHKVREHGFSFPKACREFLRHAAQYMDKLER
jgi:hypothetical protein